MSSVNLDQLHRSTLGVYESLLDQFNPGLQRLVALGNTYIQAFEALASTSEEYFHALGRMGDQALRTLSSRSLGDVIMQIAESQRRLTKELDGMFRWFHNEVLREMENNVMLDKDFVSGSRRRYEMEVHSQSQQRLGHQDAEFTHFLRESQKDALKEEERRYRFLAEKHCNLSLTIAQLMNKTGGTLHKRAQGWEDVINETRAPRPRTPSRMEQMGMREEERGQQWNRRDEQPLGRLPSRGPSPEPVRSRSGSLGDALGGGRLMRAIVSCRPSANPTMLDFTTDDVITVLVPEPRNGWLFGRGQNSTRQGWFPASYVEPLDQAPRHPPPSVGMRPSHSMSNLLDQSGGGGQGFVPPPAPPLPSAGNQMRPPTTPSLNRRSEHQQKPRSEDYGIKPDLFPRGTNPFATVKLKPTVTNDRSGARTPGRII